MLVLRHRERCHDNFVISHVKLQILTLTYFVSHDIMIFDCPALPRPEAVPWAIILS